MTGSKPKTRHRHFVRLTLLLGTFLCGLIQLTSPLHALALTTNPSSLGFTGIQGIANSSTQSIVFWKGGDRTKNWTASAAATWMTVTPSAGTITTEHDTISVTVNLAGMAPGTYASNVTIAMDGLRGRQYKTTIPISLVITGTSQTPTIRIAPTALSFTGIAGGTNPLGQPISLTNPSGGTLSWTMSDNAPWLTLSTTAGTTTTETDSISANVSLTGLTAGTYTAAITVTNTGGTNSPLVIPVSLTVSPTPVTTPIISLSSTSLTYAGTAGGSNPANQSFAISNTGAGTLTWTASDNAAWLTLSPASGTAAGTVTASVNITGLASGTYSSTITVAATGATSKTLPVTLTVSPAATTTSAATLTWGANTESDLAGYRIYMGTQSGVYGPPVTVGQVTTYQFANLVKGTTYFFTITAIDSAGNESIHSAEVSKSIF